MAVSKYERDVFLIRLTIGTFPKSADKISLLEWLRDLERIKEADQAQRYLDNKGTPSITIRNVHNYDPLNRVYVADIDIDEENGIATILFNRGDPSQTNPAYITPDNGVEVSQTQEDYVVGHSAHLVIDMNPALEPGDAYRCYFERVPTISRTLIRAFLANILIDDYKERGVTVQNAKKEETTIKPIIKLEGKKSDNLEKDLNEGYISMFEFSKEIEDFNGIDINGAAGMRQRVQIKVEKADRDKNLIERIRGEAYDSGYDEMQIHIKGLRGGSHSTSPRFKTDAEEAAEMLYNQVELVNEFDNELDQCIETINPELKEKMMALG